MPYERGSDYADVEMKRGLMRKLIALAVVPAMMLVAAAPATASPDTVMVSAGSVMAQAGGGEAMAHAGAVHAHAAPGMAMVHFGPHHRM